MSTDIGVPRGFACFVELVYLLVKSVAGDDPCLELDGINASALGIFWWLQLHPEYRRGVRSIGTAFPMLSV